MSKERERWGKIDKGGCREHLGVQEGGINTVGVSDHTKTKRKEKTMQHVNGRTGDRKRKG